MNNYSEADLQLKAKKEAKFLMEETAFQNCREDMSDLNFSVGGGSLTMDSFKLAIAPLVFVTARAVILMSKIFTDSDRTTFDIFRIVFWVLIAVMLILFVVYTLSARKTIISVAGKNVFYKGKSIKSDDITIVDCSAFGQIKVYSKGKKIISFSWDTDNSELFLAWVRKCGIPFNDKR